MKRAPLTYRKSASSPEQIARLRQIEREFHVRAFGEELARVNLDLTIEERQRYIAWMREARKLWPGAGKGATRPQGGHEGVSPGEGESSI
jgi:hypothetical protein